jgi:hypothetical protein
MIEDEIMLEVAGEPGRRDGGAARPAAPIPPHGSR